MITDPNSYDVIVTPGPSQTVVVSYTPPANVSVGLPTTTNAVSTSTETVDVNELGILGPTGPQGPQGLPGQDGSVPTVFELVSVSSWTQAHDYSYLPEVRVLDADGFQVGLGVAYPNAHTVFLSFPAPFTGKVLLS